MIYLCWPLIYHNFENTRFWRNNCLRLIKGQHKPTFCRPLIYPAFFQKISVSTLIYLCWPFSSHFPAEIGFRGRSKVNIKVRKNGGRSRVNTMLTFDLPPFFGIFGLFLFLGGGCRFCCCCCCCCLVVVVVVVVVCCLLVAVLFLLLLLCCCCCYVFMLLLVVVVPWPKGQQQQKNIFSSVLCHCLMKGVSETRQKNR